MSYANARLRPAGRLLLMRQDRAVTIGVELTRPMDPLRGTDGKRLYRRAPLLDQPQLTSVNALDGA